MSLIDDNMKQVDYYNSIIRMSESIINISNNNDVISICCETILYCRYGIKHDSAYDSKIIDNILLLYKLTNETIRDN